MVVRLGAICFGSFLICSSVVADETAVSGDKVTVSQTDCRALATYRPSQGVEYQPGVDVNGHYVAPADLPGGFNYNLPEKVEFNVQINPVNFGQRNAAQQQIAQTSQAIVQNNAAQQKAQAQTPVLAQQLAKLQATQTTLNAQQANFNAQIAAANAAIVAQTGGATPTPAQKSTRDALETGALNQIQGSSAYQSLQSQIAANNQAIASTNTAIAANNQVIAAAPGNAQQLGVQLTGAQGQAAAVTGKFDNTAMSVGHVVVNTRTGAATLDGQPLQNAQQQYLEELCRKAGY